METEAVAFSPTFEAALYPLVHFGAVFEVSGRNRTKHRCPFALGLGPRSIRVRLRLPAGRMLCSTYAIS